MPQRSMKQRKNRRNPGSFGLCCADATKPRFLHFGFGPCEIRSNQANHALNRAQMLREIDLAQTLQQEVMAADRGFDLGAFFCRALFEWLDHIIRPEMQEKRH